MSIKDFEHGDVDRLNDFFDRITDADRSFAKEDLQERQLLVDWLSDRRSIRQIAVDEGDEIVATSL